MRPLFPTTGCSLSSIATLDFEFNSACEVLPSPPPIFDQPDIEIPIDFPPQPVIIPPIEIPEPLPPFPVCIPCPTLAATATIEVTSDSSEGADVIITQLADAGSCDSSPSCAYQFDFHLRVPRPRIHCAEITATGTMLFNEIIFSSGSSVSASEALLDVPITVTRTSPDNVYSPCAYNFDFDFGGLSDLILTNFNLLLDTGNIPCMPQLIFFTLTSNLASGGSASATSTDGAITITDPGQIPTGKSIASGASGWAYRECDNSGNFTYKMVTANKCPSSS
jgi:hypothetical protein